MKRLFIEGKWKHLGAGADERYEIWGQGQVQARVYANHPDIKVAVEDIPDPLPTEPGVRFWGKSITTEPQWWFIQTGTDCLWCISADGLSWRLHDAIAAGLVRLPDPGEPK